MGNTSATVLASYATNVEVFTWEVFSMKRAILVLAVLGFIAGAGTASATIPFPEYCEVNPWDGYDAGLTGPDTPTSPAINVVEVIARNDANETIPNAEVRIYFSAECEAQGRLFLCPGYTNPIVAYTDGNGSAVIKIEGGGCCEIAGAIEVHVNGYWIRTYNSYRSPDWNGAEANGTVGLDDFIAFSRYYTGISNDTCFDYNNNNAGPYDLADFIIYSAVHLRSCGE
jgi:hypothetical protein